MRCPLCGEGVYLPLDNSPVVALGLHFERRCLAIELPCSGEGVEAHLARRAGKERNDG